MDEALRDNYRFLARYNRWFNQRLYDACEQLNDAERKRDRGAFFGSLHQTLTHLVLADKMWLERFCRRDRTTPATCTRTGRTCAAHAPRSMRPSRPGPRRWRRTFP